MALFVSLLGVAIKASNWEPRVDTLLQALVRQIEEIAKNNLEASDTFQQWCRGTTPWARSLLQMLEQQQLEAGNMQNQAENDIVRIGASRNLDQHAIDARKRLLALAKDTVATAAHEQDAARMIFKKAQKALRGGEDDHEKVTKLASLVKQLDVAAADEDVSEKTRTALASDVISVAALTEKAQGVEMQSLEMQVAERQRAQAKYHSERSDLRVIQDVARNATETVESVCAQQEQEAVKVQQFLQKQLEKPRAVLGEATPMTETMSFFQSSPPSFLQVTSNVKVGSHTLAAPKDLAQDLLKDIDALSADESFVRPAPKRHENPTATAKGAWCHGMRQKTEQMLMAQDAELRHTKARLQWSKTNAVLLQEQAAYLHARRKELNALLTSLHQVARPDNVQNDLETYARQILSLNGADVPSTLQTELGDIVENLEKTKSLLLVRDRLWDEWTEDLQAALNDIDHRLGSAFVHFQSRQLEATADAAFFLLMHGFTTDDLAMQQQYLHMLDKVCPVA